MIPKRFPPVAAYPWPSLPGAVLVELEPHEYERARLCVNACEGMKNPAQSIDQARTALKGLRAQNQQRWDEITEILKLLGDT